jgi:hypothetical protein
MGTPTMSASTPLAADGTPARWPPARTMSVLILVLMVVQAVCGLWITGVYRDPPGVVAMLRGYDLMTLVVVVPALALSVLPPWHGTRGVRLVWLSVLAYGVYNYAFYVFATAFNTLFLVHVAVFALCVFTLAIALSTVDAAGIAAGFHARAPVRVVSAVLIVLAASLAGMWVVNAVRFAVTGALPQDSYLVAPITVTHLGYVLDLALFAPACVLAGVLLWRRRPWGYVLGAVVLLFGTVYQLCYLAALAFQSWTGVPGARFDPAEPFILAVLALGTVLLLTGLRAHPIRRGARP